MPLGSCVRGQDRLPGTALPLERQPHYEMSMLGLLLRLWVALQQRLEAWV